MDHSFGFIGFGSCVFYCEGRNAEVQKAELRSPEGGLRREVALGFITLLSSMEAGFL